MSEEASSDNDKRNEKENDVESKGSEKESGKEGDKESEGSENNHDKDEKSNKDVNEEEECEIIEFSTLSKEEKIKYFNFFIANNTVFEREPLGTYICEIDIIDEDKNKKDEDLLKPNNNLRQSTFRTTKKDYDTIYSKLIKVINPSSSIKGTKMNINVIRFMIQEIYGLKFYKDTQALFSKKNEEPESFPQFVGNFLINKFSKKETLDKKSVDFMLSLDYFGRNHKDIKIFQQFLTEEYDADDLIFYLFIRSNIEKTFKVSFLEKAKENLNQNILYEEEGNDDILVPMDKCKSLSKAIFGSEKELQKNFMKNIEQLFDTPACDKKKKTIKANSILNMALRNYHETRGSENALKEEDDEDEEEEEKPKKKSKKEKEKEKEKEEENEEEDEEEKPKLRSANKKTHTKQLSTNLPSKNTNTSSTKNTNKSNKASTNKIKVKSNTASTASMNTTKTANTNKTKTTDTKNTQNKINPSSGTKNTTNSKNTKINTNTINKQSPVKKTNARKEGGSSSVGKRNNSSSKKNNTNTTNKTIENEGDLADFKHLLAKNRVDRVKNDKDKSEFLKNIISDYFRYKVIDKYFKKTIDINPMLKAIQSKITKNLKNTKEFSLRKLNAINAFVAAGDKSAFCNIYRLLYI